MVSWLTPNEKMTVNIRAFEMAKPNELPSVREQNKNEINQPSSILR